MDLYRAAVIPLTDLASLGVKKWDYEDRRREVVQRQGINRTRPCMKAGWRATFQILVTLPGYVQPDTLYEVIDQAGKFIGMFDRRPTYGRFKIIDWEIQAEELPAAAE